MNPEHYLEDVVRQLEKLKMLADKAVVQVSDKQLFQGLDEESNSIAIIMKHMAGNMRSRWTDFLTSDGEKPDRNRDQEFISTEDKEELLRRWEAGWRCVRDAISALRPEDLDKTVAIRREAHSVIEAIQRQSDMPMFLASLESLHNKAKSWRAARVDYEAITRECPEARSVWRALAGVCERLGDGEAARRARERAEGRVPEGEVPERRGP